MELTHQSEERREVAIPRSCLIRGSVPRSSNESGFGIHWNRHSFGASLSLIRAESFEVNKVKGQTVRKGRLSLPSVTFTPRIENPSLLKQGQ